MNAKDNPKKRGLVWIRALMQIQVILMFMVVGEDKCPSCGVSGKVWKKKPELYICPSCNTIFHEFGLLFQGARQDRNNML